VKGRMKIKLRGRKRERREGNTGSICRDNERAIFIKRAKGYPIYHSLIAVKGRMKIKLRGRKREKIWKEREICIKRRKERVIY
jgi:hypothetical protein